MIQIHTQKKGDNLIVGISGQSEDEVLHQYYSFWNLKATSGEFHWMSHQPGNYFGVIYTTIELFENWLIESSARIYENLFDRRDKAAIFELTETRRASIIAENFIAYHPPVNDYFMYSNPQEAAAL